jgi:peptidoglycan/LPS O-acetylase OafA/YrhL
MTSVDVTPTSIREANSYDFVRFFAATCVLFSHHFDLAGFAEPQVPLYGEDFGYLGVEIFFCLSGFLIFRSLQKRRDWVRFAAARVWRIFPNLLFALIMTSAITLAWYRNGAHLGAHLGYAIENLLMFFRGVTQTIPGVFADAVRPDLNDPLWTLPYELWLYVLLALVFLAGGRHVAAVVAMLALAVGIGWSFADDAGPDIGPFESFEFLRLGSYFLSGAAVAVAWPHIARHAITIGALGLVGVFVLRSTIDFDNILFALALALAVVGIGSSRAMAWFSKGGDPSYGIYVLAWPIQQFALLLIGSFWLSLFAAFLATVALGYGTWHAFEKRALAYPDRIAQRFRCMSSARNQA